MLLFIQLVNPFVSVNKAYVVMPAVFAAFASEKQLQQVISGQKVNGFFIFFVSFDNFSNLNFIARIFFGGEFMT